MLFEGGAGFNVDLVILWQACNKPLVGLTLEEILIVDRVWVPFTDGREDLILI